MTYDVVIVVVVPSAAEVVQLFSSSLSGGGGRPCVAQRAGFYCICHRKMFFALLCCFIYCNIILDIVAAIRGLMWFRVFDPKKKHG